MKNRAWLVLTLGIFACGGGKQASDAPPPSAPPRLPPSMSGGGGQSAADVPPENTLGSEEVTKGEKALASGDVTAAKSYADAALKKNPKDPEAFTLLGEIADKSSDKAGAEKNYKQALKIRPDLETAAVNLSAMYDDAEKWDDAEKVSRAGLSKHADNPALHFNLAVALAGKNDQTGCVKEFDEATRLSPNDPVYLFTYAHWLGVFKQSDAAATKLRAARPLAADNVGLLAAVGHEMRLVGAWADCVPTFDKAIALKDAAELRTERALCKLAGNDKGGALADLQAAVAKEPKFAPAHYYLAGQLAQGGKFKEAATEYDTYVKLAPTGPLAKQAQDRAKLARDKAAGKK